MPVLGRPLGHRPLVPTDGSCSSSPGAGTRAPCLRGAVRIPRHPAVTGPVMPPPSGPTLEESNENPAAEVNEVHFRWKYEKAPKVTGRRGHCRDGRAPGIREHLGVWGGLRRLEEPGAMAARGALRAPETPSGPRLKFSEEETESRDLR